MSDKLYKVQLARTREADKKHLDMKQWYATRLNCAYNDVMTAITRLPSNRAKQLYQEWLNEGSS